MKMTLQELTNRLQDLCHQGYAQQEINLEDKVKQLLQKIRK